MPKTDKNHDNNSENIKDFIEVIADENNHHSRDKSFRFITSKYPKLVHENFEFPGTFQQILSTNVFTNDNRNLEMDYAALVGPGGFIDTNACVNVEHQSQMPDEDKAESMFYYSISLTHEKNMVVHSIVITHIDPRVNYKLYTFHGQIFCIRFIFVDDEKISQRLSTLRNIINGKDDLAKVDTLNFAYISIFVDNDAKRIMEELAVLFKNVDFNDSCLKGDIFLVLKDMIKYHFQDDDVKTKELLKMILGSLTFEEWDKLNSYEKTLFENDVLKDTLSQKDSKISQLSKDNSQLRDDLSQKDNVISQKDNEIKKLKKQLDEANNK